VEVGAVAAGPVVHATILTRARGPERPAASHRENLEPAALAAVKQFQLRDDDSDASPQTGANTSRKGAGSSDLRQTFDHLVVPRKAGVP
jgi:hypothetical protein